MAFPFMINMTLSLVSLIYTRQGEMHWLATTSEQVTSISDQRFAFSPFRFRGSVQQGRWNGNGSHERSFGSSVLRSGRGSLCIRIERRLGEQLKNNENTNPSQWSFVLRFVIIFLLLDNYSFNSTLSWVIDWLWTPTFRHVAWYTSLSLPLSVLGLPFSLVRLSPNISVAWICLDVIRFISLNSFFFIL